MKNYKIYLSVLLVVVMLAVGIVPIYAQTYDLTDNTESKVSDEKKKK